MNFMIHYTCVRGWKEICGQNHIYKYTKQLLRMFDSLHSRMSYMSVDTLNFIPITIQAAGRKYDFRLPNQRCIIESNGVCVHLKTAPFRFPYTRGIAECTQRSIPQADKSCTTFQNDDSSDLIACALENRISSHAVLSYVINFAI